MNEPTYKQMNDEIEAMGMPKSLTVMIITDDGKVHSMGHQWGSIYGSVENEVRYVAARKAGHLLRIIARNRWIERNNPKPWGWPVGS